MHKKGFLDMVKGLLAWLSKVFLGLQSFLVQLPHRQRNLSWKNNKEKNKVTIKQKYQSAQKNVNSFFLNTSVKIKKGKIPSFGLGVEE